MTPTVLTKDITKIIRDRTVLKNVSLELAQGQIYGISGPNGAGKSMLLKVIAGLVLPTYGEVIVFNKRVGKDVEFPDKTGILIERPGFLPHYSGLKNLELLASIRNQIRKEEIISTLKLVGLKPDDKRPVKTYSTGMLQRLGIAQALMEKPQLLLLDEPTNALDRQGIYDIHTILKEMKKEGVSILLTSHSAEELKNLCDKVFYMEHGTLEIAS